MDYWDLYWRFERFRRRFDPLDFRRWKRDSQRILRGLYPQAGELLLLDATAGMGDHTVNLAEEGFRVEACDSSPRAVDATRQAVEEAGLAGRVDVFAARWEELGEQRPGRYDLIFHDALHWIYESRDMSRILTSLRASLKPGGELVFFFADATRPHAGAGLEKLEADWSAWSRHQLAWCHGDGKQRVSLLQVAEKGPDFIDEHHLYLLQGQGTEPQLQSLVMRHVYRWDWHAMKPALTQAGFVDLRGQEFYNESKKRPFAMNRARRPG